MFPPVAVFVVVLSAVCPITQQEEGHPVALRSDHASRRHDTGQLYVNVQDSFSCAETLGSKPEVLAFGSTIIIAVLCSCLMTGSDKSLVCSAACFVKLLSARQARGGFVGHGTGVESFMFLHLSMSKIVIFGNLC